MVDAVVNWVGQFPQEEQSRRIVDVLAVLRLLVGGAWGQAPDGSPRWNYEYLIMSDGLIDEMLNKINADQGSHHPQPLLNALRTTLEAAIKQHGHPLEANPSPPRPGSQGRSA